MEKPAEPVPPKPPRTFSRRRFFQRAALFAAAPSLLGSYASLIEPFSIVYPQIDIAIPGLPKSFDGLRIAQLTDLHAGRVPIHYLEKVIRHVNQLKCDLVVVTGDLTHHAPSCVESIAQLIGTITAPVIATFGNHDYAVNRGPDEPEDPFMADNQELALINNGCTVLRNSATQYKRGEDCIWFVGLDDIMPQRFDPWLAFAHVPRGPTTIALSHNPDTAEMLDLRHPHLILSGHTHGGQVRIPGFGAPYLNTQNHTYDQGLFRLKHSQLYVSRGIGFIRQVRFCCRPEVPIFRLRAA